MPVSLAHGLVLLQLACVLFLGVREFTYEICKATASCGFYLERLNLVLWIVTILSLKHIINHFHKFLAIILLNLRQVRHLIIAELLSSTLLYVSMDSGW